MSISLKEKDQEYTQRIDTLNKKQGSTIVVLHIEDKEDEFNTMGIKLWIIRRLIIWIQIISRFRKQ
jgi:aromatic ring-cleaving dioxygenase|tara:strand:- start:296 stop:493 length:198 start_codon:yes stop_codon:yes gene_type:complete